MHRAGILRG